MRKFLFKILWTILRLPAQILLSRFHPKIIAITGSVGKTGTKEAIWWILHKNSEIQQNGLRKNVGNLNTEIGVPLTILGFERTPKGLEWLWFIIVSYGRAFFQLQYPKILILEMGADKIGDIKYLTSFIHPHIAVVTSVGPAHLEAFGSIEKVAQEKANLLKTLKTTDYAILNMDNKYTKDMGLSTQAKVVYFGLTVDANIYIDNIIEEKDQTSGKFHFAGSVAPFNISNIGKPILYSALAAVAVACEVFRIDLVEATDSLRDFDLLLGRGGLAVGKKNSVLIDDTYNANPMSMQAAFERVEILSRKNHSKVVLILGDMLELGSRDQKYHFEIGKLAAQVADYLLVTGEYADQYIKGAKQDLRKSIIIEKFAFPQDAAHFILEKIHKNDIILVKGSRGAKMERAVEILKK